MKRVILVSLLVFILVGCSNVSSKGIYSNDLCVTHINLDQNICYGDEKKKIEHVTGKPTDNLYGLDLYKNGIKILYRDDIAVMINLGNDAVGVYTSKYDKVSQPLKSFYELYDKEHLHSDSVGTAMYAYDTSKNKYVKYKDTIDSEEHYKSIYYVSALADKDGIIFSISFGDYLAAFLSR